MKLTKEILKRMIKEELTRGQQAVLDLQQSRPQRQRRRFLDGQKGVVAASKKAMINRDDHDTAFLEEYVDPWDLNVSPDIFFHPYVRKQRKIVGKEIYDNCEKTISPLDQPIPHEQFDKRDQHQAEMRQVRATQRRNAEKIEKLRKDRHIVDGIVSGTPEAEQKIKELIKYDTELALRLQDLMKKDKENYRDYANISRQNFRDMMDSLYAQSADHYICRTAQGTLAFDEVVDIFEKEYVSKNRTTLERYLNS